MSDRKAMLLEHYAKLTEFLGLALGPDYEVALHDLTDTNRSIVAIANGHISGRKVGAPLTNMALTTLRDKSYEKEDYRVHYYGLSLNGKELRSSTLYIKQDGELIAMLCINFDDTRYRAAADRILGLCHPDAFFAPEEAENAGRSMPEQFRNSPDAVIADAVGRELEKKRVRADRLTADERMEIIAALDAGGIFLIKGAVRDVARKLGCSQASVYRYLSQMKNGDSEGK